MVQPADPRRILQRTASSSLLSPQSLSPSHTVCTYIVFARDAHRVGTLELERAAGASVGRFTMQFITGIWAVPTSVAPLLLQDACAVVAFATPPRRRDD